MKKFTFLMLLFAFVVGLGLEAVKSQAAPTNLKNTAIVNIICDEDGDVIQNLTEEMSGITPQEFDDGGCEDGDNCGECSEELGENIGCHRFSVNGPAPVDSSSDPAFAITLVCPGQS